MYSRFRNSKHAHDSDEINVHSYTEDNKQMAYCFFVVLFSMSVSLILKTSFSRNMDSREKQKNRKGNGSLEKNKIIYFCKVYFNLSDFL